MMMRVWGFIDDYVCVMMMRVVCASLMIVRAMMIESVLWIFDDCVGVCDDDESVDF